MMAKIFGAGKSSKNKPSAMLESAKEVYEAIGVEIQSLQPGSGEAAEAP